MHRPIIKHLHLASVFVLWLLRYYLHPVPNSKNLDSIEVFSKSFGHSVWGLITSGLDDSKLTCVPNAGGFHTITL